MGLDDISLEELSVYIADSQAVLPQHQSTHFFYVASICVAK